MNQLFKTKKFNIIITSSILAIALFLIIFTGYEFKSFSKFQTYFYTDGVTEIQKLSQYSKNIKGTAGDTDIYIIKGPEAINADPADCPSILILGGTHPNEPAGQIAATLILENIKVKGNTIVYIITEANKSAYTHSHPQEASPFYYSLQTKNGKERVFKFGSRATNTNEQWPNPDVYVHPSGQQLSTNDTRNLNRAYPGKENGTYTEQIAYGITQLIKQNDIKVTVDLHEASPEYNNINSIVYHDVANMIAAKAQFELDMNDIIVAANISPKDLHGLTHRELGDYTNTFAFLCETSNAAQGKIRGKFTEDLITYYEPDKFYEEAWKVTEKYHSGDKSALKLLYARATSIDERSARQVSTIMALASGYNEGIDDPGFVFSAIDAERQQVLVDCGKINFELVFDGSSIGFKQIASLYDCLIENGVGYYLHDPE